MRIQKLLDKPQQVQPKRFKKATENYKIILNRGSSTAAVNQAADAVKAATEKLRSAQVEAAKKAAAQKTANEAVEAAKKAATAKLYLDITQCSARKPGSEIRNLGGAITTTKFEWFWSSNLSECIKEVYF